MKAIESWDEVPAFASEDEEAAFWATHDTGKALLDQMQPAPLDGGGELPPARLTSPHPRTRPVSVRLDDDILRRLKALAAKKHKGYQSLLKAFLVERLYEEEKREGLLGSEERIEAGAQGGG
jgi:predicted transcriptional regulator